MIVSIGVKARLLEVISRLPNVGKAKLMKEAKLNWIQLTECLSEFEAMELVRSEKIKRKMNFEPTLKGADAVRHYRELVRLLSKPVDGVKQYADIDDLLSSQMKEVNEGVQT